MLLLPTRSILFNGVMEYSQLKNTVRINVMLDFDSCVEANALILC